MYSLQRVVDDFDSGEFIDNVIPVQIAFFRFFARTKVEICRYL